MLPKSVVDRFIEKCPAAVMCRATLENVLSPARLDQIFEESRQSQYQKELLFSQVVAVMVAVTTRTYRSVHGVYLETKEQLGVSPAALYAKINHVEPTTVRSMICETASDAAKTIDAMPNARLEVLRNLKVFYLDGNHLSSTEHRIAELRTTGQGALPGQSLALLDAQRGLIVDLVTCEDAYAQERTLLPDLLERLAQGIVVIADRNFCTTKFLFGLSYRKSYFAIRQHGSTLTWRALGKPRRKGRVATGNVFEQAVELRNGAETLRVRRITIELDNPTENGDKEIHVLTNLSENQASAKEVAAAYKTRWTVESAFQSLTDIFRCEVNTLGYPRAALFSFATAVLAFNVYAVVKAAIRSAHGTAASETKLSDYHLLNHVVATYVGMDIVVDPEYWEQYQTMSANQLSKRLIQWARRVDLSRYPKKTRGPNKPPPQRKSGARNHHVSTARLLKERRN